MTNYRGLVRSVARRIARAADSAIEDHNRGLVEQEPQLTDRWLGRIAESLQGYRAKGVTWTAKTLTDRGPGAQEKQYGADFIGVLDVYLPEYKVRKGFLAQAKVLKGNSMDMSEFRRMLSQCEQMLTLSPDSFVFLYSNEGIRVVPAIAVVGASHPDIVLDPEALYSRKVSRFYEEHLECFIGDRDINEPNIETLHRLQARSLLHLAARQSEEK
jgi:hypothetical protein